MPEEMTCHDNLLFKLNPKTGINFVCFNFEIGFGRLNLAVIYILMGWLLCHFSLTFAVVMERLDSSLARFVDWHESFICCSLLNKIEQVILYLQVMFCNFCLLHCIILLTFLQYWQINQSIYWFKWKCRTLESKL